MGRSGFDRAWRKRERAFRSAPARAGVSLGYYWDFVGSLSMPGKVVTLYDLTVQKCGRLEFDDEEGPEHPHRPGRRTQCAPKIQSGHLQSRHFLPKACEVYFQWISQKHHLCMRTNLDRVGRKVCGWSRLEGSSFCFA